MDENFGWLDLMVGDVNSGLIKEVVEYVKIELGDSVYGYQFFEVMCNQLSGFISGLGGGGFGFSLEDVYQVFQVWIGLLENMLYYRDFN